MSTTVSLIYQNENDMSNTFASQCADQMLSENISLYRDHYSSRENFVRSAFSIVNRFNGSEDEEIDSETCKGIAMKVWDRANGNNLIYRTLAVIQNQTGITLKSCDSLPGVRHMNDKPYFNVEISERVSESSDYTKLLRFAKKYGTIHIEPNGLNRLAIFPSIS